MEKVATMVEVMKFLGYDNIATFRKEWAELSDKDKDQLKRGIGNGSLTY